MALVTKNFSDIITFTRASTATFFNSSGVLTSAAINDPRFDYDPLTLAARGLLIEEMRANLLPYSEQFDNISGWVVQSTAPTITPNTVESPAGTFTADTITFAATDSRIRNAVGLSFTAGVSYTFSIYVKAVGTSLNKIRFAFFDGAQQNSPDLIVSNAVWTRLTTTFIAANTTASGSLQIRNATDNLANSLYIWGAQLEAGAFPTSYIPTTTTALTRNADVASVNTLAPWYNATEGTLYGEITDAAIAVGGVSRRIANINDGTEADRITIGWAGATSVAAAFVTDNSVAQAGFTSPAGAYPFPTKVALAYKAADFQAAVNGSAFATVSSGTVPTVNRMTIGDVVTGTTGAQNINGHVRRITYYPRRLSQAELAAITA
jgi:hypothetical protein